MSPQVGLAVIKATSINVELLEAVNEVGRVAGLMPVIYILDD